MKICHKNNGSDARTEKGKSELERVQIIGEEQMSHMEETERRIIREWIERIENNASLEAQQAYCQGYVDCIFLLSSMGIIEKGNAVDEILDHMKK